jgi:ABC-2 type transport system ATP-binding protein
MPGMNMGIAIETKGLTKRFADLKAVDNVTLSIGEGELFGLLGPNGSGKTTMIKLLTGQIAPTSGDIIVHDVDVVKESVRVRELVGIMPEQENPPSFLTAEEYLGFVARIRNLANVDDLCEHWLWMLDFEDQRDVLCKDLSRGTRQKLMFAQAFIHEPRIALIDEPLINLDPLIQHTVKDYLLQFVNRGGTIFFSTHVLEIAEKICSSIGIINDGRLIFQGSMKDVRRRKRNLDDFFLRLVGDAKDTSAGKINNRYGVPELDEV